MSDRGSPLGLPQVRSERRVVHGALAEHAVLPRLVSLDGGQPEVDQLGLARVGDQDIGGLQVAVRHALFVRVLETVRQPEQERQGLPVLEPHPQPEKLAQVHPFDILHDHIMAAVLLALVLQAYDVGVPQPHAGLGFLVKPQHGVGHCGEPLPEHLDGRRGSRLAVLSAVNSGECPLGQVEQGAVVAEEKAGRVALLQPLHLPARQPALAHESPDEGFRGAVFGLGPGFAVLLA